MHKIALVTGANRGIGLEVCRQLALRRYKVILTSRDSLKGQEKAALLKSQGLDVLYHRLDVADRESIQTSFTILQGKFGHIDILINNAGVLLDDLSSNGTDVLPSSNLTKLQDTLQVNLFGPYFLCELFVPVMMANGFGRVVNVSSESGQLSTMGSQSPNYSISKAALNAVTRVFSVKAALNTNVLINSVCPGWVKTDMGGAIAPRTVEKGAEGIIWAATLPSSGPSGGFFRDGKPLAW